MKNVYNSCMGLIFAVNDPRGFRVICTDEIWINKILVKRPWLDGWQDLIISTIEKPDSRYFQMHCIKIGRCIIAKLRVIIKDDI